MAVLEDAIGSSFEYYTSHLPAIRDNANEHGCVLWENVGDGSLVNSKFMVGPKNGSEIDLYGAMDGFGFEVLKHYVEKDRTYLGDYHTHPNGSAYPKELPSDCDLFRWGSMCDLCPLWELWPLLRNSECFASLCNLDFIPLAQKFQILQPARFGDILLIHPVVGRRVFTNLKEQKESLEPCRIMYKNFVISTGHGGSIRVDRTNYRAAMRGYIATINQMIRDRVTIDYIENAQAPAV